MIADARTSAAEGRIEWAPLKSFWVGGMLLAALLLGPVCVTPGAIVLFVLTTIVTLCAGHSVGMHRLLVHRSFSARPWVESPSARSWLSMTQLTHFPSTEMCLSSERMIAHPQTSATIGTVRWSPARSFWIGGMTLAALALGPVFVTPGAIVLFLATSAVTLCAGHSVGLHRLLIHRSFRTRSSVRRILVYFGTLVGMAGPLGMVRLHDMRDWAQRQRECHAYHAHRASALLDAWWQLHCRLMLARPPRFVPEPALAEDRFLCWLERSWMLQQLPWAGLFLVLGGMPWLVWGIPVRVAVSLTGHWLVGHVTHRRGPQSWVIDGVAVQGHDLPLAALITFGEAWHGNHHAWPSSARLGLEPGQHDPGWWLLRVMRRAGLAWDLQEPRHLTPRSGLRRVGGLSGL